MDSIKNLHNDIEVAIYVLKRLAQIREDTGYGTIKLDIKNNVVVYSEMAVREHLN